MHCVAEPGGHAAGGITQVLTLQLPAKRPQHVRAGARRAVAHACAAPADLGRGRGGADGGLEQLAAAQPGEAVDNLAAAKGQAARGRRRLGRAARGLSGRRLRGRGGDKRCTIHTPPAGMAVCNGASHDTGAAEARMQPVVCPRVRRRLTGTVVEVEGAL